VPQAVHRYRPYPHNGIAHQQAALGCQTSRSNLQQGGHIHSAPKRNYLMLAAAGASAAPATIEAAREHGRRNIFRR